MIVTIKKLLGLTKPERKRVKLPEGLCHLEVVPARGWWN